MLVPVAMRSAVVAISRLAARGATLLADGETRYVPLDEVQPGMVLRVAAGERMPVDAMVLTGRSELDRSLVTGESAPFAVAPGARVEAGTLNLSGAKIAQAPLARLGLWTLLELWHASQAHEWVGPLALIGTMAGETLSNLAANAA